ncbi:hypothetical protein Gotri_019270, partial [Gossypium trilobum]|nr:hypothetical protein [Gossypium trilobum]
MGDELEAGDQLVFGLFQIYLCWSLALRLCMIMSYTTNQALFT